MWLSLAAFLLAFVAVVRFTSLTIPPALSKYAGIAVLAGLDVLVSGARSLLEGRYHTATFLTGLLGHLVAAVLVVYLGAVVGLDLVLAVSVALGISLFWNLLAYQRQLVGKLTGGETSTGEPPDATYPLHPPC